MELKIFLKRKLKLMKIYAIKVVDFLDVCVIINTYNVKQEVNNMSEERDDLVVLVDENGEEVEFEHLDTVELNGNEYVILLPVEESEEEKDIDEVVILKIEHGEEEDSFVSVDDDDELDAVFEEFKARMEEEFDFDD